MGNRFRGEILVIDDDADDHEILKAICEELGICGSIRFFNSGNELVQYLASTPECPFIILCDINMPCVNGLDLRESLFKDYGLRRKTIPFIFFSTAASQAQVDRAFDLTVQGFFLKGNSVAETARRLKLIIDYWAESMHPYSSFS